MLMAAMLFVAISCGLTGNAFAAEDDSRYEATESISYQDDERDAVDGAHGSANEADFSSVHADSSSAYVDESVAEGNDNLESLGADSDANVDADVEPNVDDGYEEGGAESGEGFGADDSANDAAAKDDSEQGDDGLEDGAGSDDEAIGEGASDLLPPEEEPGDSMSGDAPGSSSGDDSASDQGIEADAGNRTDGANKPDAAVANEPDEANGVSSADDAALFREDANYSFAKDLAIDRSAGMGAGAAGAPDAGGLAFDVGTVSSPNDVVASGKAQADTAKYSKKDGADGEPFTDRAFDERTDNEGASFHAAEFRAEAGAAYEFVGKTDGMCLPAPDETNGRSIHIAPWAKLLDGLRYETAIGAFGASAYGGAAGGHAGQDEAIQASEEPLIPDVASDSQSVICTPDDSNDTGLDREAQSDKPDPINPVSPCLPSPASSPGGGLGDGAGQGFASASGLSRLIEVWAIGNSSLQPFTSTLTRCGFIDYIAAIVRNHVSPTPSIRAP